MGDGDELRPDQPVAEPMPGLDIHQKQDRQQAGASAGRRPPERPAERLTSPLCIRIPHAKLLKTLVPKGRIELPTY